MPALSPETIAGYRENGFYFPIRVLPPDEAKAIGDGFMAFTRSETARRYPDPNNQIYLLKAHLLFAWADRVAHEPALLDAVRRRAARAGRARSPRRRPAARRGRPGRCGSRRR